MSDFKAEMHRKIHAKIVYAIISDTNIGYYTMRVTLC